MNIKTSESGIVARVVQKVLCLVFRLAQTTAAYLLPSPALAMIIILIGVVYTAGAQEAEPIGIATAVKGQVTVMGLSGETETVVEGAKVFLGDIFETGDESGVKLLFEDDTLISLGANAVLEITEFIYTPTARKSLSKLTKGKLKSIVQKLEGRESVVEYATPNAVAGIKGTTLFLDYDSEPICVLEGEVFVRGFAPGTEEIKLESDQCASIIDGELSPPFSFTNELKQEFFSSTEIKEDLPLRDSKYKEEYPGKEPPPAPWDEIIGDAASSENFPTAQPIDLLPGVDAEDRAPVDIIVP